MDVTALSNAFFVKPVVTAPGQFEVRPAAGDRQQQRYAENEGDGPATAENVLAVNEDYAADEKVRFKDTLSEQCSQPQVAAQENVQESPKSDNSTSGEVEKYVLAVSAAISSRLEELTTAVQTGTVQAPNPALAVLTYLKEAKLADNPGNAAELGQFVETASGGEEQGQVEGMANQAQVKAAQDAASGMQTEESSVQTGASKSQQTVKTVEAVGKELGEQGGEKGGQQAVVGQPVRQAVQLQIDKGTEDGDSEQVKGETAAVLNRETVAQVRTTGQNDSQAKGTQQRSAGQQVEQIAEALGGQIKGSTDKGASKDESGGSSILRQDNSSQAVISTDTAGDAAKKATEVFEAPQTRQSHSGKELFDNAGQQIQASINNSVRREESEVTVRLNPPELGKVFIKLQQQDGQITGLLEFSKAETKAEIQQLLPQLVRNLQDAGVAVKRLDVVQTQIDNSGGQQFKEHVAGDGTAYQQQFSQGQPGNVGLGYDWMSGESIYSGAESLSESYISDGAVNVLV